MTRLTIEIPEALARRLARLASEQNKSVEQVCVEQLQTLLGKSKTRGTWLTHHDSSPRVCSGRRGGRAAILQLRCLPGPHTSP
jgi:hypothetical protein